MPRCKFGVTGLNQGVKYLSTSKTFRIFSLLSCAYIMYSLFEEDRNKNTEETQLFVRKSSCAVDYTKQKNKSTGMKYILLWSSRYRHVPWNYWKTEQRDFIENNCSKTNCFVTFNKSLFGGDVTRFDAIIFDVRDLPKRGKLPQVRSPCQKYIFYTLESAANFPVCDKTYDGFFNWTMTYKLDSDIVHPYFLIKNNIGEVVGPKINMQWVTDMKDIDKDLEKRLRNKTKAAAWFVSKCRVKSRRDVFVRSLKKHLKKNNLTVDIYGKCGSLRCSRSESHVCNAMLENDYYFYLALENSFHKDYVTEKVLTAVENSVVPIVFGGANYSRFLPPGSYIDGRAYSTHELGDIMYGLMQSQTAYSQYFKWKNYYTFYQASRTSTCYLCEVMNNWTRLETISEHKQFRHWWNSDVSKVCN